MGVRRIVTGHDDNGKAIVIADGDSPNIVRPDNRPGVEINNLWLLKDCLLYTSPSPRDGLLSRMPSSA